MRTLRVIVFVLAMLVLTTQGVRHVYVRYIEPRVSTLDRFDDSAAKKIINEATTLSELVREYEPARKKTDELDASLKAELSTKTRDEYFMLEQKWKEDYKQEYEREDELKRAIQGWERKSKEILELRVFWLFGLGLFLIGLALLSRGLEWFGMALLMPGIVEMIWWTSPPFGFTGNPVEFDRLLNNKLLFTLVTIAILVATWLLSERKTANRIRNE